MSIQHKAFKFRIYPTQEQEVLLNKTFGCCRFVWNKHVEGFNSWTPAFIPEKLTYKIIKDNPEYSWLNEVSAAALQSKDNDFREFKNQYFNKNRKKKLSKPKFKKKGNRESYSLPNQKFTLDQEQSLIRLEKIGWVPVVLDRIISTDVNYRSVTVSKVPSGKFFVSILVQINIEPKPLTGKMVGIDLGLNDLFILSNGEKINNPKNFSNNQVELKRTQQHRNRKKKGSNRYEKQRVKVAKIHEKIVNKRKHLLHEVSTQLVTNYDVICTENLNVAGMTKNHKLAKAIQDASWSSFVQMLEYKCNWYGKTLIKIDQFYPSSKTCSCCGHKMDSMSLDIRNWTCPNCGSEHDRDINAAKNILAKGFSDLTGEEIEFTSVSEKLVSVECIEYKHGEAIRPILD